MNYYSEEDIRELVNECESNYLFAHSTPINIRLCRNCEYYMPDVPTIDTDGDFGYCEYRTDFNCLEETMPINWYFTDINGFCNGDDVDE